MSQPLLSVQNLSKRYGRQTVVDQVGFDLAEGELLCILGPSGCGKTTILRAIGGFITIDGGSIRLDGREISGDPPENRNVCTVFQSYGLFPQQTVAQNIAYGLKMRHLPKSEREQEVQKALALVELEDYAERYPGQLSGGQRQRVALARSLVLKPRLLLLDEPLSNLDAKLRIDLREKIRELQQRLQLAMIFVTHDQEEAFSLADRVLLMNAGQLVESGTPEALYHRPQAPFTLDFIGHANQRDGRYLRYEDVQIRPGEGATITAIAFKGRFSELSLTTPDGPIKALLLANAAAAYKVGDQVAVELPWKQLPN